MRISYFKYFFLILGTKSDEFEYNLINDLLRSYNMHARPSLNHNEATNVTFALSLTQLIDVTKNILIYIK